MNVLKLAIIMFGGLGLGFTTTGLIKGTTDESTTTTTTTSTDEEYGYGCFNNDDDFIDNFLSHFSTSDQQQITDYLNTLLADQGLTLDDVNTNWETRHDIMFELHQYVEDQGFEYTDTTPSFHGHMGW